MVTKFPFIKQLRDLLGTHRRDEREQFDLRIDLSPMGTPERVEECQALKREFQQMTIAASVAHKAYLRGHPANPQD